MYVGEHVRLRAVEREDEGSLTLRSPVDGVVLAVHREIEPPVTAGRRIGLARNR